MQVDNEFTRPKRAVTVSGSALGRFAPLSDIFGRMIADQGRGGAAVAVYHRGELVADLVGGTYSPDSVQLLFSVSKGISAIVAAHAAHRGLIDLDEPLAAHWPEFARPSTAAITTRMALSHRSGIASLDRILTMEELLAGEGDVAIAAQEPYWTPGTAHGYHSFTYGLLLDGIFRRVVGESVAAYLERELARPLGLDLWLGIPDSELGRAHPTEVSEQWENGSRDALASTATIPPGTTQHLRRAGDLVNDPRFLQAGWPAVSGTASARSLARLFAATLGPVEGSARVLDPAALARMTAVESRGIDVVLGIPIAFGSGVQLPFPQFPMLSPSSFGHEGADGCYVVADPELELVVAFTTSLFPPVSGASIRGLSLLPSIANLAR